MYNIARYQKISDEYTTHRLRHSAGEDEPTPVELCEIDGWTYVALPDGIVLPEQIVDIEHIEPDKAIGTQIINQSRFVRQQMMAMGDYDALLYLDMKASAVERIVWGKLSVDTTTIPADSTTTAKVTYTSKDPVTFIVDGESIEKIPNDVYTATLTVAADAPGYIEVRIPGVERVVTITVTEVEA